MRVVRIRVKRLKFRGFLYQHNPGFEKSRFDCAFDTNVSLRQRTYCRKDYSAFEKGVNAMIAEKLIAERGRDYMTARRVSKEYEVFTRGINKSVPSVPPTGSADELKQIELWQRYISWERSNPLRVEDPALVTKRVMFAYEQVC